MWWLEQSDAARKAIANNPVTPELAIKNFNLFFAEVGGKYLWSHATFDAVVFRSFCECFGFKGAWHYRDARDIRTISALAHDMQYVPSKKDESLVEHNALDDAIEQAKYVSEMYQFIRDKHGKQ